MDNRKRRSCAEGNPRRFAGLLTNSSALKSSLHLVIGQGELDCSGRTMPPATGFLLSLPLPPVLAPGGSSPMAWRKDGMPRIEFEDGQGRIISPLTILPPDLSASKVRVRCGSAPNFLDECRPHAR